MVIMKFFVEFATRKEKEWKIFDSCFVESYDETDSDVMN